MDIEFFGGNCVRLKTKQTVLVFDDALVRYGKKTVANDKTTLLYTQQSIKEDKAISQARLVLDGPGEYEVGDVTVTALPARAHTDEEDGHSATVFQCMFEGKTVTVLGHVHPELSAEVTELISGTDLVLLPVGGNGYTLDPTGAASIVKRIEPDVVVPTQYEIDGLSYEVPAQPIEEFAKVSALNLEQEAIDSIKLGKTTNEDPTQTMFVVLRPKAK